jgi:hypothetical protein
MTHESVYSPFISCAAPSRKRRIIYGSAASMEKAGFRRFCVLRSNRARARADLI